MAKLSTLLEGWRGDLSTGRLTALAALSIAMVQEFRGAELQHVALWLSAGIGSYGVAKGTEMVVSNKGDSNVADH